MKEKNLNTLKTGVFIVKQKQKSKQLIESNKEKRITNCKFQYKND